MVGYLIAGVILGNVLSKNFVQSSQIAFFGELGVALLLFSLGLEFSIKRIASVYRIAVLGGVLQIAISSLLGYFLLTQLLHTSRGESIFVALLLAFSSTAVVAKILAERGALNSLHGEILLGWLIIQDIAVLPVMALLPFFTGVEASFKNIAIIALKPFVVLYLTLIIGRKIVPKIFIKLALLHNRELLVVLSFVFCILFSLGALNLGLSFALGAFLAGVCLSASGVNDEVFMEIKSIRDIFAAVFFVALGFLVDVNFLYLHIPVILILSATILLTKFAVSFGLVLYEGYHSKIAFFVGLGLVQIGEFGFILAKIGLDKGVISSNTFFQNSGKGTLHLRVNIRGKSAHAAYDNVLPSVNAFEKAIALLVELNSLKSEIVKRISSYTVQSENEKKASMVLGGEVNGCGKVNTIPDFFSFTIDRRFLPEENMIEVKKEILDVFERAKRKDSELKIDFEVLDFFDAIRKHKNSLEDNFLQAIKKVYKKEGKGVMLSGGTDMRLLSYKGIPCIGYSPHGENMHADNEYVSIKSMEKTKEVVKKLIKNW